MSLSSKLLVCAIAPAAFLLTACSGEPSNSEIKAALDTEFQMLNEQMQKQLTSLQSSMPNNQIPAAKIELKEVNKQKCDKQSNGSYVCEVEIKISTPPIGEQTVKAPIGFAKEGSDWKVSSSVFR